MISRRTTRLLADAYASIFSTRGFGFGNRLVIDDQELYGFLFERNHDPQILARIKRLGNDSPRFLRDFILGLHTGTSLRDVDLRGSEYRHPTEAGQFILADLICDILFLAESPDYAKLHTDKAGKLLAQLRASLELDGYSYQDGLIGVVESNVIDEEEEEGILERLITELALSNKPVMVKHLDDSVTAYVEGRWWDCVGNSRAFMESVLREIADKHCRMNTGQSLDNKTYDTAVGVRQYLERIGLFSNEEISAVAKIYGLMSGTGNHPFITDRDQARLGRNLALIVSQFALLKLQNVRLDLPKVTADTNHTK